MSHFCERTVIEEGSGIWKSRLQHLPSWIGSDRDQGLAILPTHAKDKFPSGSRNGMETPLGPAPWPASGSVEPVPGTHSPVRTWLAPGKESIRGPSELRGSATWIKCWRKPGNTTMDKEREDRAPEIGSNMLIPPREALSGKYGQPHKGFLLSSRPFEEGPTSPRHPDRDSRPSSPIRTERQPKVSGISGRP